MSSRFYVPDAWAIMQITDLRGGFAVGVHWRVLAGWYGGWGGTNSWQLNSGIVRVEEFDDHYVFYGASGSAYRCDKGAERMSSIMRDVYARLQAENDGVGKLEIVQYADVAQQLAVASQSQSEVE